MKVPLKLDYLKEEQKQPSVDLDDNFLLDIDLNEVIDNKPRTKKRKKNKKGVQIENELFWKIKIKKW